MNARPAGAGEAAVPAGRAALRSILEPDYRLYNHFLALLQARLQQLGPARLEARLANLRTANNELTARCRYQLVNNKDQTRTPTTQTSAFKNVFYRSF